MKTTSILSALILMMSIAIAQTAHVPAATQSDLKTRFPMATGAKWAQSGTGFEAEWKENGKEIAVLYDAKGSYRMTEREIDLSALPATVSHGFKQQYPAAQLMEAESQTHANGSITYEIEFKSNGKVTEMTLDGSGNRITQGTEGSDGSGEKGSDGSDEKGKSGSKGSGDAGSDGSDKKGNSGGKKSGDRGES
jgi:hypothetical protein